MAVRTGSPGRVCTKAPIDHSLCQLVKGPGFTYWLRLDDWVRIATKRGVSNK